MENYLLHLFRHLSFFPSSVLNFSMVFWSFPFPPVEEGTTAEACLRDPLPSWLWNILILINRCVDRGRGTAFTKVRINSSNVNDAAFKFSRLVVHFRRVIGFGPCGWLSFGTGWRGFFGAFTTHTTAPPPPVWVFFCSFDLWRWCARRRRQNVTEDKSLEQRLVIGRMSPANRTGWLLSASDVAFPSFLIPVVRVRVRVCVRLNAGVWAFRRTCADTVFSMRGVPFNSYCLLLTEEMQFITRFLQM